MGEIRGRWRKGNETTVIGSYLELTLQKIEEESKFSCPQHCQKICEYKKAFSNNPMADGFIFTTLMLQLRNISADTMILSESEPWVTLFDKSNNRYFEQEVCDLCNDFIEDRYKGTRTTKNVGIIHEGTKAEFFLFFPQLQNGAEAARLRLESYVVPSFFVDPEPKHDVFFVWINTDENRILTLDDFPKESIPRGYQKNTIPAAAKRDNDLKTQIQINLKPSSPSYSDYRFRPDFSKLPPVRIAPITSIHRQEHDIIEIIKIVEESTQEREPLIIVQPTRPRRHYPWSIEDEKIFSYEEATSEHLGYCEGCENFGYISYFEGLFLCPTCSDLLHE